MKWIAWLQDHHSDFAVSASTGSSSDLIDRINDGTLDIAVVYRASQRPGLIIEHIFDEELAMVTSRGSAKCPQFLCTVDVGVGVRLALSRIRWQKYFRLYS